MLAAALAALVVAQSPGPTSPDLALHFPETPRPASFAVPRDPGPFRGWELLGAGAGVLVGDLAVVGLAWGTLELFTSGAIAPTATNFRRAAYGLGAATLLLPPLGATLGAILGRSGPAYGAGWKAYLLALVGHAAALVAGYLTAPSFWALVPVQLATMSAGSSVGLHWGGGPRGAGDRVPPAGRVEPQPGEPRDAPAETRAAAPAWLAPLCLDRA